MASFKAKVEAKYSGSILVEAMSNLRSSRTGVEGVTIWISSGDFEGKDSRHGPRIKVVVGGKLNSESLKNSVSITLANPPKVLGKLPSNVKKQAVKWVLLNLQPLLSHWRGELDSGEVIAALKKLS